jgi:hypothetical protein
MRKSRSRRPPTGRRSPFRVTRPQRARRHPRRPTPFRSSHRRAAQRSPRRSAGSRCSSMISAACSASASSQPPSSSRATPTRTRQSRTRMWSTVRRSPSRVARPGARADQHLFVHLAAKQPDVCRHAAWAAATPQRCFQHVQRRAGLRPLRLARTVGPKLRVQQCTGLRPAGLQAHARSNRTLSSRDPLHA